MINFLLEWTNDCSDTFRILLVETIYLIHLDMIEQIVALQVRISVLFTALTNTACRVLSRIDHFLYY